MIDKRKVSAAKYYKQQQNTIEEKDREITMLIENKNKKGPMLFKREREACRKSAVIFSEERGYIAGRARLY